MKRENRGVYIFSAAAFGICMILALPYWDTAMRSNMEFFWGPFRDELGILALIFLGSFALEFLILSAVRNKWVRWILPVFSAILLIGAEADWMDGAGDWNLMSVFLWFAGFPLLMGACGAAALRYAMKSGWIIRLTALLLIFALVVTGVVFWPQPLEDWITLAPETQMLVYYRDGTREWMFFESAQEVLGLLGNMDVVPCGVGPEWDRSGGLLLRIHEDYVLMAPHPADDPYIYRCSGPLEEFDGSQVCWRVFGRSILHGNLTYTARYFLDDAEDPAA